MSAMAMTSGRMKPGIAVCRSEVTDVVFIGQFSGFHAGGDEHLDGDLVEGHEFAFDTGGCSETVAEGCGIIIQEKTVDAIIGALDGLCPKTESISRSCADIARCFDENDCFEEYVRLCREQL